MLNRTQMSFLFLFLFEERIKSLDVLKILTGDTTLTDFGILFLQKASIEIYVNFKCM